MIVIIWISDLLDGYFARKLNQVSELGKILDPLADKIFIISIGIILLIQNIIPLWFVIVIIVRDIIIFSGGTYLKYSKKIVPVSNWIGKISVFIIGCTLVFSVIIAGINHNSLENINIYTIENLELYLHFMFLLSIVMSMVSLIYYSYKFKEIVFKK
jgi:CDP-diacylglycerol--glycerol-3-phosphate 3-phosphatidyltransferase